jgi:hypothetical protein
MSTDMLLPSAGLRSKPSMKLALVLAACFMFVPHYVYFLTLKMVVTCFPETSTDFLQTTQHFVLEDGAQ